VLWVVSRRCHHITGLPFRLPIVGMVFHPRPCSAGRMKLAAALAGLFGRCDSRWGNQGRGWIRAEAGWIPSSTDGQELVEDSAHGP